MDNNNDKDLINYKFKVLEDRIQKNEDKINQIEEDISDKLKSIIDKLESFNKEVFFSKGFLKALIVIGSLAVGIAAIITAIYKII